MPIHYCSIQRVFKMLQRAIFNTDNLRYYFEAWAVFCPFSSELSE